MKHHNHLLLNFRLAGAVFLAAGAAWTARADYPGTVISQGPAGYWQLNETTQPPSNVAAVNSGSLGASANGTFNAFPLRGLPGPFSGSLAVQFDGSSQSVTTPYQAALNPAAFSIELWVNPASATVPGGLLCVAASMYSSSPREGWLIYQSDGSAGGGVGWQFRMYNTNGLSTSLTLNAPQTPTPGTWTHLVFTFDGTTAQAYINGAPVASGTPTGFYPNASAQFSLGVRSDGGFFWPGQASELAYYNSALSAARVSAHYTAATTAPATYGSTVQADAPILYWPLSTPADPVAANSGTLGSAANGLYIYDAHPGVAGPVPATFPGFAANNNAVQFDAGGGVVRIPALNLNTNSVTISAWVKANGLQANPGTALVICHGGTTDSGLTLDTQFGSTLGLGMIWAGNNYGWSPQNDSGLPPLPDGQWAYVALVIQPDSATLYICDANYNDFASATINSGVNNPAEAFDGATLIGSDTSTATSFNGDIDEVAVFNQALSQGQIYTEYAAGVGGVPPKIFADLQGPSGQVAAGDPIVLAIDVGGSPTMTYLWHKDGSLVATTTSGTFTIPSSALTDSGTYDVTVTNTAGLVQSQPVVVTVVTPTAPTITGTQGFVNRVLYPSGTLNMSVSASGGGLKYQWYKNAAPIAEATASAYTIQSVTNSDAANYSVSLTNSVGSATNGPVAITIPTPAVGSYESLIVASQPEAWWRLDEPIGATNMWDGMGRHDGYYTNINGTTPPVALGAPGALSGDSDTAASFTLTGGGIGIAPYSSALNPSQFTLEGWAKTSDLTDTIVPASSSYNNNGCYFAPSGGWWFIGTPSGGTFGNNGNVNTAAQIVPGQWSHLVLTFDATRVIGGNHYPWSLYVNGQTDGYVWSAGNNTANQGGPFIVGGRGNGPGTLVDDFFNGSVDEVAVYGRVLSGTEIQNHFNGRFGSTTPPYFAGPFVSQTVPPGKNLTYSTIVYGSLPITLQWYKNGSPIAGATTTTLALTNVQVSDTGTYALWATNGAGTASDSVTVTVVPPVAYANDTNGLVLHLKLDGDLTDSSGRGNNGTPVGAPTFGTGLIGQDLQTATTVVTNNGTNLVISSTSYVTLGTPADLQFGTATSFSFSLWIKLPPGATPIDVPFIGTATNSNYNPGWDLSPAYEAGGIQWNLNDGVNNVNMSGPANTINDGQWHHFAVVFDRTNQVGNTYLDGLLVASPGIGTVGSVDVGGPVTIAQDPTGSYFSITGAGAADFTAFPVIYNLDDMGVWRRALTPREVVDIYSAGLAGHNFSTPAPPMLLKFSLAGGNLKISWSAGTLLQSTTLGPSANWTPVAGAAPPSYTVHPTGPTTFYRVLLQ
jgi:hypothetical protein